MDDAVTVTHFSLDSWGQIEQKTTSLSPKISNQQSQNPFNPFTNDSIDTSNTPEASEEEAKPEDDKKKNTNPFIDSNPFLGILNPFKDLQPVTTEKKVETDTEKAGARVVKTEEIQTTTTTLTHKDESQAASDISPWLVADPSQSPAPDQTPTKHTVITRKTVITTQL